ncbi:UNVERIFIED_CONTAM: hypothetical protein Sradi_1857300, partial [Sesamum radiatum]
MRRKVLSLSQSFNGIKEVNLLLPSSTSKELVEDPLKAMECSQRWKVKTAYGDVGLTYQEDQTVAYGLLVCLQSTLPYTVSSMRAMMEVWPGSLERINLVEPSQSMQRAGQSLVK